MLLLRVQGKELLLRHDTRRREESRLLRLKRSTEWPHVHRRRELLVLLLARGLLS